MGGFSRSKMMKSIALVFLLSVSFAAGIGCKVYHAVSTTANAMVDPTTMHTNSSDIPNLQLGKDCAADTTGPCTPCTVSKYFGETGCDKCVIVQEVLAGVVNRWAFCDDGYPNKFELAHSSCTGSSVEADGLCPTGTYNNDALIVYKCDTDYCNTVANAETDFNSANQVSVGLSILGAMFVSLNL